ncbi:hypothetical protein ABPG74_014572 [Tetrahymena malaccensis]
MNQNLVTLQFGPLSYAYGNAYFYLEGQQFFEEDDPIEHSNLFKNLNTKTPRNIAWGKKDELDVLKFYSSAFLKNQNKKNGEQTSNKVDPLNPIESLLWEKDKIQVIQQQEQNMEDQEEQKQMEQLLKNKFFPLFKETQFDRKYQVELPHLLDQKFEVYQEGQILAKSDQMYELNEDKIRLILEESDYVNGFQVFVDADSGFGGFCEEVLQIVLDECPKKPIITYSLYDYDNSQLQNNKKFVNEIISLDKYREMSSILVPINLNRLTKFSDYVNYNSNMELFDRSMLVASILSGFTGGYRAKESNGLQDFYKNIVSYPSNNIFNSTFTIPIIKDENGTLLNEHIFNYQTKRNQFNYLYHDFDQYWNEEQWGAPESFGESYFLRGVVQMPKEPPKSNSMQMRIMEALILYKTKYHRHLFSKNIQETYLYQLDSQENYQEFSLPLHTTIFSNEQFSTKIQQLIKGQQNLTKSTKVSYYQLDYSEEDFAELKTRYQDLYEAYAKNEQLHLEEEYFE